MKQKISILIDTNEKGSDRAKAIAAAASENVAFELPEFAELPVDIQFMTTQYHLYRFSDEDDNDHAIRDDKILICNVEFKEIDDFWASKNTGHLGTQIMNMVSEGQPGFVAVLGSLQEVMQQVPKVKSANGRVQKRNGQDIAADVNTSRALAADAIGCNVPVHFLSSNLDVSMRWILSYAKNILTGPNMSSWLPRFPVDPRGYCILASINGIGDVAAKGLLEAYGGISRISNEAKYNQDALAACKINGRALGKAKAAILAKALG